MDKKKTKINDKENEQVPSVDIGANAIYLANNHIAIQSNANKHTRAAIEALSRAAEENAKAIAQIAKGLDLSCMRATGIAVGGNY